MSKNLVDRSLDPIALKLEKSLPDSRIHDLDVLIEQSTLLLVGEEVFKNMEECFEVDEFRSVVLVKLTEVLKDILLKAFHSYPGSS